MRGTGIAESFRFSNNTGGAGVRISAKAAIEDKGDMTLNFL
jgi:hypothetical protein